MGGGFLMIITDLPKKNATIVSRKTMEKIISTPIIKYDAAKAEKQARKNLRKQGLKV